MFIQDLINLAQREETFFIHIFFPQGVREKKRESELVVSWF